MAKQSDTTASVVGIGERHTRQRDVVFGVIVRAAGPLTVAQIHERAAREVESLGIATVYRTLKLLAASGQLRTVLMPDGETRYEPADRGHHHHFHCRVCDQVFDLEVCPVTIPRQSNFAGGYRVESHEVTLHGVCPACPS